MEQIIRIGMDTSKHVFQLHGVNAAEQPILRKKMRRKEMVDFFARCPPTVIAIEACGASHHWARVLTGLGHEIKLIAPQLFKPYVKRGKNDAADVEALCEAMSRPTMRFVSIKSADQQAALMLVGMRERAVAARTQLANTIRGYAAEFGLTAAKGISHIPLLLERVMIDESIPASARDLFASLADEFAQLDERLKDVKTTTRGLPVTFRALVNTTLSSLWLAGCQSAVKFDPISASNIGSDSISLHVEGDVAQFSRGDQRDGTEIWVNAIGTGGFARRACRNQHGLCIS